MGRLRSARIPRSDSRSHVCKPCRRSGADDRRLRQRSQPIRDNVVVPLVAVTAKLVPDEETLKSSILRRERCGRVQMRAGERPEDRTVARVTLYVDCVRRAPVLLLLLTVAACTAPSSEFARRAAALNMTAERVRGDPFDHMV